MKFRCIAGRRIARSDVSSGNVYFYFADQVGSPRAVTQADGTVCFSADYVSGERTTSCVVCASVAMLRHDRA